MFNSACVAMEAMVAYMDILAMLLSPDEEEPVIVAAGNLAEAGGGHANAVLFEVEPKVFEAPAYMTSEIYKAMSARAHEGLLAAEAKLKARLAREGRRWMMQTIAAPAHLIGDRAAEAARLGEISIISASLSGLRRRLFEGLLFGSGRPLIIIPRDWKGEGLGRNIVIGWNATREAARAIADAMPLMELANKVTIISVIDSERPLGVSSAEALGAHLARCGISAEARTIPRGDGDVHERLKEQCRELDADLLVMGGYGRARLQEFVFGGVTRAFVNETPLPLFMSH